MILVTGGFGFIGSNLIRLLNSRSIIDIVIVDDLTDGRKMMNLVNCQFSRIYDPDEFFDQFTEWDKVAFIFHEGAISSTREMNGKLMLKRNFYFSQQLFGKAFEHKIPFQYASSASVYGTISPNTSVPENAPMNPQTPYAFSKYLFDIEMMKLLNSEHFNKMEFNIQGLRYFNVYGPNESHKDDQASPITKFTKQARETGKIKIFEGSENIFRDFIHVNDVVKIKLELAFGRMRSGIFNIGTGKTVSFFQVADLIAKKENASIEVIPFPEEYKNAYQYWTCADIRKLHEVGIHHNFNHLI